MNAYASINAIKATLLAMVLLPMASPSDARTHRSQAAKAEFQRQHPCPSTGKARGACPGYVKDHIKSLDCGGADAPTNMQWQTVADGKAKDKWERKGCGK